MSSSATPAAASGTSTPGKRTPRSRRNSTKAGLRRKPTEFMTPSGRRVLVALPEDAEALRSKYASVANDDNEDDSPQVEVVVHGSAEHKQYLQEARDHHEAVRAGLQQKHGAELLAEWDRATADVARVTRELEQLADHSASLGHNFSKFGYSAALRTYGGEGHGDSGHGGGGSGHAGGAATPGGDASDDDDDDNDDNNNNKNLPAWHSRSGTTMQLFRRPTVKQYFHKGLLWRASDETSVQSFELFFDLLYVGIIAINGDHAAEEADGFELLRFVVTFCLSWKVWSDVTQLVSWFATNDVLQRVEILFLYACQLAVTANMVQAFYGWPHGGGGGEGEGGGEGATTTSEAVLRSLSLLHREEDDSSEAYLTDTYPALTAYYVTARLFMALYCFVTGLLVPLVQGTMFFQTGVIVIGAALWIASMHLAMPERLACVFVALAFDLFGGSLVVGLYRYGRSHADTGGSRFARFLNRKVFDFYPAINIEHKVERMNAFIALVLGYSVVGVLYQNTHGYGLDAFLGKAVLGLVQAYVLNWVYFDIDAANIHVHAIRWGALASTTWQYAHLVFTLAFILSSAALSRLVVATDCANADIHHLTDTYHERSAPTVSLGLRLYYSTGLGVSLLALAVISMCHQHKTAATNTETATARLGKPLRLANRCAVAAVLCTLPAAQGLTSLQLVSIATGLLAWVLVVEVYGQSCVGDALFFTKGGPSHGHEYTAHCSQRRLRQALAQAQQDENARGNAAGRRDEEVGKPAVDVNVLSRGKKHGAVYME